MKIFPVFLITIFLSSCGNSAEVIEEVAEVIIDGIQVYGTVKVNRNNCPVYIEAIEEGEITRMYPVNLDDSFKVDGQKINFDYTISKAKQPLDCPVDKVVTVYKVTKVE